MPGKLQRYGGYALITGASAGIGVCFARDLAKAGVPCVLVARRADKLRALCEELRQAHGVDMRYIAQDLAAPGAIDRVVEQTASLQIGMLINNAGFGDAGKFETRDPARLEEMVRLNCVAPVLLSRAYIPPMLERGRGAMIIISSTLGLVACPYEAVYGATKAFDLSFGEALWAEYRGRGIDVVSVCPSATETEFLAVEGHDPGFIARVYKSADKPEHISKIGLAALGRRHIAHARDSKVLDFVKRGVPRTVVLRAFAYGIKKMGMDR